MGPLTSNSEHAGDDDGGGRRLLEDLLCSHCGYNLRGLLSEGRCPECGTEVARSLRGDLLAAADPAWLERLIRGHLYVTIGYVGFFLFVVAVPTMLGWVRLGLRVAGGSGIPGVVSSVVNLIGIAGSLTLVLTGVVGITSLDPRLSLTEEPMVLRRIARGAAIAALLVAVSDCSLQFSSMMGRGVDLIITIVSSATLMVASAFTLVAASLYLARLCERIPVPKLARKIRSAVRAFVVVLAIVAVAKTLERLASRLGSPSGLTSSWVVPVLTTVAALLPLLCYVFAIHLMSLWLEHRAAVKRCRVDVDGDPTPE